MDSKERSQYYETLSAAILKGAKHRRIIWNRDQVRFIQKWLDGDRNLKVAEGGSFLVGRSGVLTPSLSWQYNTHDSMDTANGVLLQVSSAVRANVGYTVMW